MAVTVASNVIKMTASGDEYTPRVLVKAVRWVSKSATANDDCELQDLTTGQTVYLCSADGSNFRDVMAIYDVINGLKLAQLDSGVLYVYLK